MASEIGCDLIFGREQPRKSVQISSSLEKARTSLLLALDKRGENARSGLLETQFPQKFLADGLVDCFTG